MNLIEKWKNLNKKQRKTRILIAGFILLYILTRINLPIPAPLPKQYPLKQGSYEQGDRAYRAGNYGLALANFIYAASHGSDIRAMSMASRMYDHGQGVHNDLCRGTYWADRSARDGNVLDQMRLSQAYFYSIGLEQDDEKAYFWARAAMENKNKDKIIKWYEKLTGVKVDRPAEWMKYLRFSLGAKAVYAYDSKYANWNYKKALPAKITRIFRIPYVSVSSDIVDCRKNINDPSIYDRW